MKKIALLGGSTNAMEQLMQDVEKHPTSFLTLKYSDDVKYMKFLNLVNELAHDSIMSKEIHYFRNKLNKAPNTIDELIKEKDNWELLSPGKSIYHMYGENGEYNMKFVSKDGHFEAVYNKDGYLVHDPINMGTYNYASPTTTPGKHVVDDVVPFYRWDNKEGFTVPKEDTKQKYLDNIDDVEKHRKKIINKLK